MKYEISKSLIKLDELEYIIREINYGELNKTWVNSIENAWIRGAFLDKRGIVWIKYQYLPKLARMSILYPLFLMLLRHLEKGIILDILRSCIVLLEIQIKLKY